MTVKTCFKCRKELPINSFYKHSKMADGYLNKCKECTKKDVIENRDKNIDYYRHYDRERGNRQSYGYVASYRKQNPEKYHATSKVNNAIRDGRLFKENCEVCGAKETHAHHDDYSKPLDVRWLCPVCHAAYHKPERQKQRLLMAKQGTP